MPGNGHGLDLDERVPRRLRPDGDHRDIFCMVKQSMSDQELIQAPLLVYPHSFLPTTEHFINQINGSNMVLTAAVDEGRAEELLELASHIEKDYPHLARGVAYLRSLCDAQRRREPCPDLKFISAGPRASNGLNDVVLGNPMAPPKPHKLQVVFHHRRA